MNFAKFLRTPFLQNTSGGCFWVFIISIKSGFIIVDIWFKGGFLFHFWPFALLFICNNWLGLLKKNLVVKFHGILHRLIMRLISIWKLRITRCSVYNWFCKIRSNKIKNKTKTFYKLYSQDCWVFAHHFFTFFHIWYGFTS